MARASTVRIFLADGKPEGLRIVEKSNWTGICLMCSRSQFPEIQHRSEFDGPGIYVLKGPDDNTGKPAIYVGEADVARSRLAQHARDKDFWTHLILFSSKDENLNKAHVQFLESRLIEIARQEKRAILENGNVPIAPNLSEPDRADLETFLDEMLLIYPLLGLDAFEATPREISAGAVKLFLAAKNARASGADIEEGFIVFAGAEVRRDHVPSLERHGKFVLTLRSDLLETGVLEDLGSQLRLVQDYVFSSPSTAAMVVLGRTANGWKEWKTADGLTLRELQGQQLRSISDTD